MKTTRILIAEYNSAVNPVRKTAGFIRADIWRRYGGLKTVGKTNSAIRSEINELGIYKAMNIDGTIRAETTKDIVNDILLYKAAAKQKVRQDIAKRTTDNKQRKQLYTLLKSDAWLSDNYLHRRMRKHFKHGKSNTDNQFIVRSDRHTEEVVDGKLIITIKVARKFGENIKLVTTSNGKNVDLTGVNLRVIDKDTHIEVHYAAEKVITKPCGEQVIGVDKGYTEALTDSDGEHHGKRFGQIMTTYSDVVTKTGKSRNKLHALEKKHREAGRIAKADRILKNNLGRKKITARKERAQKQLRDIAYRAAHSVVDKAALVVSEDLTAVIASKHQWKNFNRRMSAWAKGVLAQALEEVTHQRGGQHTLVNAAYTSQMDSTNGLLEGKRVGDKFYRANGDVLQADVNAARNVLARLSDTEINRFTPFKEVRSILLSRSPAQLSVKGLELDAVNSVCQPSADKSLPKLVSNFS